MKVVLINAVCEKGSTGRICAELCDDLIEQGHQCTLLYGNDGNGSKHSKKISNTVLAKLNALWSRITGFDMGGTLLETYRIIRFLKRYKPNIVHLHNLHGHYVNLSILCRHLAKNNIATAITLHDCWFFTGKCTYYTAVGCHRWQTGCHDCPQLKQDIPSWFFDRTREMWFTKRNALLSIPRLAVIGVSDWITNEAKQSFLQDAALIRRIYNWIDLSVFYQRNGNLRSTFNLPTDKFFVLCISASWHTNSYRFKDLIALSSVLPSNTMIALAGQISQEVPLPDNVIPVGYIDSTEKLAQLYSTADVYVHLSREDTFGKVIAEAMACGTPAIVYRMTACSEIVSGGCGYGIKAGNMDELVSCIRKIQENGKKYYSKDCACHTRENFEKEHLIVETVSLYEDMLAIEEQRK